MNIDERLDRLTERHEALTQSVELLFRQSQQHDQQIAELGGRIREVLDISSQLLQVVRSHENRINRLEGRG